MGIVAAEDCAAVVRSGEKLLIVKAFVEKTVKEAGERLVTTLVCVE